ncbi:hypothetical protein TWF970_007459 [Orbilia oligospora]|uniref:Uncharacterized protein n=1 Tax=Orbilia oligospora TaxID=2813651 RepID=A0A7C8R8G8_ORBOL|nr:hypothetical protein TWF970_007459 [Orbilia oligospora]
MTRAWATKLDEGTTQDKIGGSALHLQDLLASSSSFSDQADVGLGTISAAEKAALYPSGSLDWQSRRRGRTSKGPKNFVLLVARRPGMESR